MTRVASVTLVKRIGPIAGLMSNIGSHEASTQPVAPGRDHFGTFALPAWREAVRALGVKLIPRRYPRLSSIVGWPIWRLSLLARRDPVDLEPFPGFRTRLYPKENHADTKCFARACLVDWQEEVALAKVASLTPDNHLYCVDVGANTGTYSILMAHLARKAGRNARLVCIEANPQAQQRLTTNLMFSGLLSQTDIVGCAVSDRDGAVTLRRSRWNLGSASICTPRKNDPGQTRGAGTYLTVPSRRLLDIALDAGLPRIDLLKIDIEGHEVPALRPFLRDAPRHLFPRTILAETKHERDFELSNLLIGAGYEPTLHGRSDTLFTLKG